MEVMQLKIVLVEEEESKKKSPRTHTKGLPRGQRAGYAWTACAGCADGSIFQLALRARRRCAPGLMGCVRGSAARLGSACAVSIVAHMCVGYMRGWFPWPNVFRFVRP